MNLKQAIMIGLVGALTTTVMPPALNAQTCSGNGDVVGVYAFLGSRSLVTTGSDSSGGSNTGGTTDTTGASNTPLGLLLSDINGTAVFGTVGRITADGAGNLFATPVLNTSVATQVGTYSVNGDCTINEDADPGNRPIPGYTPKDPAGIVRFCVRAIPNSAASVLTCGSSSARVLTA